MKKSNLIVASILGFLIILLLIMLIIAPFMQKDEPKSEEINNTFVPASENEETILPNVAFIKLGINSIVSGSGARTVKQNVVIDSGGTYNLSGALINGSIHINTQDIVVLNLNNVNISSEYEAIVVDQARKVVINIPLGSENYIQAGVSNTYMGAIASNSLLEFTGEGKLVIDSAKMSISSSVGYLLNGGNIMAFGNDKLQRPEDDSSVKSLFVDLNQNIQAGSISLIAETNQVIMEENVINDFQNLIISNPNLDNEYTLYRNYNTFEADQFWHGTLASNS